VIAKRFRSNKLSVEDCWLYAIASKEDLARRLSTETFKLSVKNLDRLSADAGNFKIFNIRQGDKTRAVQEPKRDLQKIHARIHKLLSRVKVPDYLHSAVKGKSYLTNARAHALNAPTIKIDIKKFFPSVSRVVIFEFFHKTLLCRKDVSGLLADLLTYDQHLATGSSASPIIAYYSFKPMFDELAMLANRNCLVMTCYVDDVTMSGTKAEGSVLFAAHQIIAKTGLRSHKMKVFAGNANKVITGVCNSPTGERVPNKLHLKIKNDFDELHSSNSAKASKKILVSLLGRMEAARQIDPAFGARAKTLRAQAN
jgi:RNA-directed DNA polymerase